MKYITEGVKKSGNQFFTVFKRQVVKLVNMKKPELCEDVSPTIKRPKKMTGATIFEL